MSRGRAGQNTFRQHEQFTPERVIPRVVGDLKETITDSPRPAVPYAFGDMLEGGDGSFEDVGD